MSLMRFNYRSSVLGKYVDISIVLPTDRYDFYDPEKEKYGLHGEAPGHQGKRNVYHPGMKFQTVYLIHGGGDDDSLTYRYTNAERYAQENNVMLVTPDIANSFGVDADYGIKFLKWLPDSSSFITSLSRVIPIPPDISTQAQKSSGCMMAVPRATFPPMAYPMIKLSPRLVDEGKRLWITTGSSFAKKV